MEQYLSFITLGVADLERSLAFYRDGLGWSPSSASAGDFTLFQLRGGIALALYPRHLLAEDAGVNAKGSGFNGVTLAHLVESTEAVDTLLKGVKKVGGRILKPAEKKEWGGYSGYFADPDGNAWEVAWNPFITLENGLLNLP